MFRRRNGVGLAEWLEKVQPCLRARHLTKAQQAFFLFVHLEGEARQEIKFRPPAEQEDSEKIIVILREHYCWMDSYIILQETFFSQRQKEGESLLEFSLVLMGLLASVKECAPYGVPKAEVLLWDQFIKHVLDGALRREFKQFVRGKPAAMLLEVRSEAIRWEHEGLWSQE